MCFGVCITKRGMVYFGASIHIFVTLILFIGSSIRAYHLSTYEREDSYKEVLGAIIIATYFFVLLMLGLLIFRATEQKNSKLLGWTSGIFITLETFAFVFNLIILSPMGVTYDEYGLRNFGFTINQVYIVISSIFLLCIMGYCATIIMYISKLKEDGDVSQDLRPFDDDEAAVSSPSNTNALSRTSSRTPSTYFNQKSQSQTKIGMEALLGGGGGGGGGGAAAAAGAFGGCNLMDVVREAKRIKEEQAQKDHKGSDKPKQRQHAPRPHPHPPKADKAQPQPQPHPPPSQPQVQVQPQSQPQNQQPQSHMPPVPQQPMQVHQHSQTGVQLPPPHPHLRPITPIPPPQPIPHAKFQEQQTQTPLTFPHPHPPPPIIQSYTHSQTLPHQRRPIIQPPPLPQPQSQYNHDQPYFLQDYSQRGILSAPSFASVVTASIAPNRFRNPHGGLRTTKSGTLGRFDSITPPPIGNRLQSLHRQTSSSCSSMDPNNPNWDIDQWEQPRVQALKYNYHYNALRRGTHRSDYGNLGVEV